MKDSKTVKPLIGITTYLEQAQTGVWDVRASFLPEVYIKAVTDNGGIAVALPPQEIFGVEAKQILESLDGVILAGGADVNPALYGEEPGQHTDRPRHDRDSFELALVSAAIETKTPYLGICRGAQMLNVALGGTLIQHLPDEIGHSNYQVGPAQFSRAKIEVAEGSKLGDLLGENKEVNAHLYHHQAIGRVATELSVTGRTTDGVIESVELQGHPFCIAVQWHPEENSEDTRILQGFIKAATKHKGAKA